ncbi:MAG: DUF4129 domain-containing protein [Methanobacteriota archaeon]|nr:MAG: DUF4129 domain-containing protein [Euryarchaeota archaeon]
MRKMAVIILVLLIGQLNFGFANFVYQDRKAYDGSSASDESKAIIKNQILPPSKANELPQQMISKSIKSIKTINSHHRFSSLHPSAKEPSRPLFPIKVAATQENHSTAVGSTLSITGTLKSGSVPWTDEPVVLIRPGYANVTVTTDSVTGDYQFDLTYTINDIGRHNYTVYFPGNPSLLRVAAVLKYGVITVTDTITMKATTDQVTTTVPPNTGYNVIITFEFSDGTPFDPTAVNFKDEFNTPYDFSTLALNVTETYQDTGGGTPDTSTALNQIGLPVSSDTITLPSNTGNQIASMNILLSVFLKNFEPFTKILTFKSETDVQNPYIVNKLILQIEVEFVFTASFFIDGVPLDGSRYYRNNQNITVFGQLSNAVLDPSYVRGVGYTWTLQYGTSTIAVRNGKTDVNGQLQETFFLNKTTFNNPLLDVRITVQIDTSNSTITNLNPSSVSTSFGLYEYIASISVNSLPSTSEVYAKQGDQFVVNGTLLDVDNKPVESATVKIELFDSLNVASSQSFSASTDATGFFQTIVTLPDLSTGNGNFSILTSVINGSSPNSVWYVTAPLNATHGSFNFTRGAQLTVQNLNGVPLVNGDTIDVFNITFFQLLQSDPNYTISVVDFFGRAPLGMNVKVVETGSTWTANSNVFTVNSTNNGNFVVKINDFSQILNSTGPNAARLLNRAGDSFVYTIVLLDSSGGTAQSVSETYRIYGPDEEPPTLNLNSLTIINANTPNDVNVSIALADPTQVHNIRNVTIWFRLSVNSNVNDTTPDFTGQTYEPRLMINDTLNNRFFFTFKFNTSQNGIWIDFYIIAYDLAGNGLDINGITIRPPAYDPSYTLSYDIRTDPNWSNQGIFRMGDTAINPINMGTDVTVNGTQLGAFDGNVDNGSTLVIIFNAPSDASGISKVYIVYRTRTIDPITLQGGAWSDNITAEMQKMNDFQWNYTFGSDLLVWGVEIDYRFLYRDSFGNTAETEFTSELFSGSQIRRNPVVIDETTPTVIVNLESPYGSTYPIAGRDGNNGTAYEVWTNETVKLILEINDFDGSGLKNVTVQIIYYDENGTLISDTTVILYESSIFGEGQALNLTYTIPTDSYAINGSFTWIVNATDKFGNSAVLNQDGISLIIREPPTPPLPPDQTVISTEITTTINGSVVTLQTSLTISNATTTTQANDFRGLIILGFFILGLVLLVVYYKRHTFLEYLRRRNRARLLTSRLQDITDDIVRLAKDGNYKEAVLLIWQAFERACREALQSPRKYNMTVRMYVDYIGTISLVDPLILTTLAHIFEKARYGNEEITEDDFKEAFNALEVTIQTLIATGARKVILEDEDEDFDIGIEEE